ncbi:MULTISPECIES: 3-hydroxyisobutyrate dehydrogenase [Microbacterium]|uniref:3-hydroxyisobutyrate dehydrogenase n=1 Tax=Microbacterium TaxID=33882 RepID=UPI00217CFE6F|nr:MULTISPECIES: 3-hydroxyisobutyrate dehydrogenase [Microbacterium]UWF77316.1 3-hydroxyisobutyrate dehydrogenase [Microbacterium neungamense]WCM55474.1 3-hydroxyisobutyrate dehydrogenase [Microbacterium sp. EF45047]
MTRIGFLGLGHMGLPMAKNLVKAGHEVLGYDVVPAADEAARAAGIPVAESGADAVADADVVITMFPAGKHVIEAYRDGLLAAARPGTLFIESSTIAVDEARTAHEMAVAAGHRNIDAPVSGGVVGAENATLAFMVGGSDEDFAEALPLLEAMGKRIVHCGGPGLGQAAKVCNNMILGVTQIAVAEAFVLGERLGLEHQVLFDVVSQASGQCWALTTNCPVPGPVPTSPANRDYQPGFAGALMAKDLGLALQAIEQTSTDARMGRLAQEIYSAYASGEGAARDFSGIITEIRDSEV